MNTQTSWEQLFQQAIAKIKETSDGVQSYFTDCTDGDIEKFLKIAWNYEENYQDVLSFQEVLTWGKHNINTKTHSAVCLIKERENSKIIELYICFLDKNNEPCLSEKARVKKIICKALDDELNRLFADKSMIILK